MARPALPHREDLGREAGVVVEVEGDVVETRAHEPAEEPQLGGLEQTVGVHASPHRLAVGEPEAYRHRARHQDAVPAEGQGAQLQDDGAGGVEHTVFPYTARSQCCQINRAFLAKFVDTRRAAWVSSIVPLGITLRPIKESRLPPQAAMASNVLDPILQAGPLARFVLGVLLFFSVICWALIVEKWWEFRAIKRDAKGFMRAYREGRTILDHLRRGEEVPREPARPALLGRGPRAVERLRRRGPGGRRARGRRRPAP